MKNIIKCPKCNSNMKIGIVASREFPLRTIWAEAIKWGGLTYKGKIRDVKTYCCQGCGFLENYAEKSKK